jgi:hypothetical protein
MQKRFVVVARHGSPGRTRAAWSAARRLAYLLRPDVDVPVSRDPHVFLPASEIDDERWFLVSAVEQADQPGTAVDPLRMTDEHDDVDLTTLTHWGFDVCDATGYSALANCRYAEASELEIAVKRWGPRLSELHLLTDLASARELQDASDARVPEHAPFYVLRLYGSRHGT